MKPSLTAILLFCISTLYGQSVPVQQPVEERYPVSYWWWIIGVAVAIGAGIVLYMLIKKDPRRDAVR